MFAIINISGKQFKTSQGLQLKIPYQKDDVGKIIKFERGKTGKIFGKSSFFIFIKIIFYF